MYFDAGAVWLGDSESKQMSESVTATDWVVQPPSEGKSKSELHFQKMFEFFKSLTMPERSNWPRFLLYVATYLAGESPGSRRR